MGETNFGKAMLLLSPHGGLPCYYYACYNIYTTFFYKRATMQLRVEKSFAQIYSCYWQLFVVEQRVRSQ